MATELLWLTKPKQATALATVTAVRGDRFTLDRSLFAPTSRAYRHPQPHDTGTVWLDGGDKRRLESSWLEAGILWHRLRGAVPTVGATLRCHLDADRRLLVSRTHTAMHLLVAALQTVGAPPMRADPTVKLGGNLRLEFAGPIPPKAMATALAHVKAWSQADRRVTTEYVVRGMEARTLDAQSFHPANPYPGPDGPLSVVRVEGVNAFPCDGTHVERTSKIGGLQIAEARPVRGAFLLVGRVEA